MSRRGKRSASDGKLFKRFFVIVSSIVGVFILVIGLAFFAFTGITQADEPEVKPYDYTLNSPVVVEPAKEIPKNSIKNLFTAPRITTALILGTDQTDSLSDVNILAFFNSDTCKVNIISVPRDLYTTISQDLREDLENDGKWVPGEMKLTELHSYGSPDMGDEAVKMELEEEFGLAIDYTVNVSLESFRKIVDIVGPITMEIPEGGFYYHAPDQNLTINVPGGVQELDGKMAEGVVRYRDTYQRGDLQRIEVQQQFLRELFKQILNKDKLLSNAPGLLATMIEFVDTDFSIDDSLKYIPYISKLNAEGFETSTLPGESGYKWNGEQNISYFIHDPVLCSEMFNEILYGGGNNDAENENADKHGKGIQVFNGGTNRERYVEIVSMLKDEGYTVYNGGKYTGSEKKSTRVFLKGGVYDDILLSGLFAESDIEKSEKVPWGLYAVIVTGNDE